MRTVSYNRFVSGKGKTGCCKKHNDWRVSFVRHPSCNVRECGTSQAYRDILVGENFEKF